MIVKKNRSAWLTKENRPHRVGDSVPRATQERLRLAAIVDSSDDAIFSKSFEGVVTSWNRAAEQLFGFSSEEMLGSSVWSLIPETRRQEEEQMFERLAAGERIEAFETVRRRKDGSEFAVSVTLSPIRDGSGRSIEISAIARDVSTMKALIEARDAAEAANKELESFSYSVAHDLRAPLRGIDGYCQALIEDYGDKLDEKGLQYLAFVRGSAQLMARLIDEMLGLSRVTRREFKREKVDLSALARNACARLEREEPQRRVELVIQEGLVDDGDSTLLAAALENLLGNAWKFTSKRGVARIEFGKTSDEAGAAYFVRDDGAGFDMAYAAKLFGVFQRLHGTQEFEGNGVGLATVQRIVKRHGGRVWAKGSVDAGATFYFTLGEREQAP
jgi:PAS domain S-box-containing protein